MSINIRYPNITATNEREQIAQIRSYLHQLVEQLNYALPNIGSGQAQTGSSNTYSVQGGELSYYDLRSLIIQQVQSVEGLFEQLSQKMETEYIKDTELPEAINDALAQAKESGEFDGPQGEQGIQGEQGAQGEQGIQGDPGQDGYTPQKGVDYFTEDEVAAVATQAAEKIVFTLDEDGNLYYEVANTDNEVEE